MPPPPPQQSIIFFLLFIFVHFNQTFEEKGEPKQEIKPTASTYQPEAFLQVQTGSKVFFLLKTSQELFTGFKLTGNFRYFTGYAFFCLF